MPLARLGWKPKAGQSYRADLGVLRGDGQQTTQRVYWSNKATAITADVPSEAELTPRLWGVWRWCAKRSDRRGAGAGSSRQRRYCPAPFQPASRVWLSAGSSA